MISTLPQLEGYVIFNPDTGLYSRGGTDVKWTKLPKLWTTVGAVKNHLALHVRRDYSGFHLQPGYKAKVIIQDLYKGCKVINIADGSEAFDIHEYMLDHAERMCKRYGYEMMDRMK
jgi:hypothetical protein